MTTEAKLVGEVEGWELRRWEYDGAPLQAEKSRGRTQVTVEAEKGELAIELVRDSDYYSGTVNDSYYIPLDVIRAVLADYDARNPPAGSEKP